jgi:hypothetical protein
MMQISYVEKLLQLRAAKVLHTSARLLTVLSARDIVNLCNKAPSIAELEKEILAKEVLLGIQRDGRWLEGKAVYQKYQHLLVSRRLAQ